MQPAEAQIFGGSSPVRRSWMRALARGAGKRCPRCGKGRLFAGYTRTAAACAVCGLDFTGHRADDAPPYVTIMIVGHVLIPLALVVRQVFEPSLPMQFAMLMPAIIAGSLWMLPVAKGALVGVQWANRMHGFGDDPDEPVRP